MAQQTFAQLVALPWADLQMQFMRSMLSGQNIDGTAFSMGTVAFASGSAVTISDPATPAQKLGVNASGQITILDASPYPSGATPITASSGNVANAVATATLAAGGATKTTYISGFTASASGATAGLPVVLTVTNTVTGTLSYIFTFAVGALIPSPALAINFPRPIPANALNTTIVVSLPAGGLGNTNAAVVAHGFQL